MNGFEDRCLRPDVGAWSQAKAADQTSCLIGEDVAEHVLSHDDIKLVGVDDQLHRSIIDDLVLELDTPLVLASNCPTDIKKQSLGVLENVRLVHKRDFLAAVGNRVIESEACDALGAEPRDDHNGLGRRFRILIHPNIMLDANVQTFQVLPDHYDVHLLVSSAAG